MKQRIADDSKGDSLRDRIHEGHRADADKGRNRAERILPVNLRDLLHHEESDDDESGGRRKGRDREEDRGEEEGEGKESSRHHGRKPGASALRDPRGGLHEGRDGRGPQAGSRRRSDRVRKESPLDARKLSVLIQHIRLGGAADQRPQSIKDIHKEKGEDHDQEVEGQKSAEIHL